MVGGVFHCRKSRFDDVGGCGEIGFARGKTDDGSALCFECFGFGVDFEGG
jgi:hypothetical protein